MSESESVEHRAERDVGRLLVIGGAEDRGDSDTWLILPRLVEIAGGSDARILVCGSSSRDPERVERIYKEQFETLGVSEVFESQIDDRIAAESGQLLDDLERATAVFFTGGDQLRLVSLIAGTRFGERVREKLWMEHLVVAGTSAGAAAMSSTMLVSGPKDGTVRRADVTLAPGLGYWRDTTIDTHFSQRGRVNRLLAVFGQNPQVLGLGIDEDTAIEVTPGKKFEVIGRGGVLVFDGRVTHSSAPDVADNEVMTLTDSIVHVLAAGYGFDLVSKRPILRDGTVIPSGAAGS
ncbi:MAG TPA: cyanophycinase [Thermoanaerobaculia bacterium]|nr:cyanophycinase [Thermoanaerobaculia bacterium]